jgi:hypothetical protein
MQIFVDHKGGQAGGVCASWWTNDVFRAFHGGESLDSPVGHTRQFLAPKRATILATGGRFVPWSGRNGGSKTEIPVKTNVARNPRFLAAFAIRGPFLRQIKTPCDGKTGMMIGDRERYRCLAVGLFTQLPAILMRHPNRMLPLLRYGCVVDDPCCNRLLPRQRRQYQLKRFLAGNRRNRLTEWIDRPRVVLGSVRGTHWPCFLTSRPSSPMWAVSINTLKVLS